MTSERVLEAMRARAQAVRARAAVRQWEYRQRHLAAGVWYRLRRVLADAKAAYAISEDDARRLIAEGYVPEACGRSLAPEKTLLFIDEVRLSTLPSAIPIPITLGPQMLTAPAVALIAFEA